jgi:hypothetical protein
MTSEQLGGTELLGVEPLDRPAERAYALWPELDL